MRALDRKTLRDVWRWRGQAVAIGLIVACGIAGFVTLLSVSRILNVSLARYYDTFLFADVFDDLTRAPETARAAVAAIPGVAVVSTRVATDAVLDVPGMSEPASGRLISIPDYRAKTLNDLYLRAGRYIRPGAADEVIASEPFAAANDLHVGDRIAAVLNGRLQRLQIVGLALSPEFIYATRPGDLFPDDKHFGILWMSRQALSAALDMTDGFNEASVRLAPGASQRAVIAGMDRVLGAYGGTGAYGRADQLSDYLTESKVAQYRSMAVTFPIIFLGVAAFLLHVLLSRLVGTQRDQIAVLKAFGYTDGAIAVHYLGIASLVVGGGLAIGVAIGWWWGALLTSVFTDYFHFPIAAYRPGLDVLIIAFLISAAAAVAGALSSVRRAVRLPPAEAMRPEAPARFHATLLERTRLLRSLSPIGRIIVRNLERKPAATAVSVLGVSFAVALLMLSRFLFDSIDRLIAVEYRFAQHADATITFDQAVAASAADDLATFPGVLQVETFRNAPARITNGAISRRIALVGLPINGRLRDLVGADFERVQVPPSGAVLTEKLAQVLHVRPGQDIQADVLDGRRPKLSIPVVGVVNELVGMSAYLDLQTMHRLLGDGETISGAYLKTDASKTAQLSAKVKQTPAIAGLIYRGDTLKQFDATIAQQLLITGAFLLLFACVMAFGVVYNSGRISLSERARELSTLRILGFSRFEVWSALFGEQLWLTAVALPLGFSLGAWWAVLLGRAYDLELLRLPAVLTGFSFAFAFLVTSLTVGVTALVMRRRTDTLDLVAVLKAGD